MRPFENFGKEKMVCMCPLSCCFARLLLQLLLMLLPKRLLQLLRGNRGPSPAPFAQPIRLAGDETSSDKARRGEPQHHRSNSDARPLSHQHFASSSPSKVC